jgi:thioredoxin 2
VKEGVEALSEKVKVVCPDCGAVNNYPLGISGKKVVCGRCKSVLPEPGAVIEPLPNQIAHFLQNTSLPVLVDFYSPTCAPCHVMNPVVESLAQRKAGELMVVKINVDQNYKIAIQFGIQGVPTFLVLFKGLERGRTSGAMSETDLSLWLASRI